jgi:peptidoglycan/xylan/chitin deacetylase (PgdA/CDA1 family)
MQSLLLLLWLAGSDAGVPAEPDASIPTDAARPDATAPDATAPDASPQPVAAPLPAPPVAAFGIASVRTQRPVVALTFDACATLNQDNGFDREIFEILKRDEIPVTIFPTGRWIETHPAEARELAAQPWVELGNHSYSHVRMTRVPRRKAVVQIAQTEELIHQLGRQSAGFRPPAGAWDRAVARMAAHQHLPTILWDVVSGDPGERATADRIVKAVLPAVRPGSIVIFHINGRAPHTKEALPEIIRGLRDKGFAFVTISQLLRQPDARQRAARPSPFGYRPLGHKKTQPKGESLADSPG